MVRPFMVDVSRARLFKGQAVRWHAPLAECHADCRYHKANGIQQGQNPSHPPKATPDQPATHTAIFESAAHRQPGAATMLKSCHYTLMPTSPA